jgi:hypothetical protein
LYLSFRADAQLSVAVKFLVACCGPGDTLLGFVRRKDCIWRLYGVFFCGFRGRLDGQVAEAIDKDLFEGAFDVSISCVDGLCGCCVDCCGASGGVWSSEG